MNDFNASDARDIATAARQAADEAGLREAAQTFDKLMLSVKAAAERGQMSVDVSLGVESQTSWLFSRLRSAGFRYTVNNQPKLCGQLRISWEKDDRS